MRLLLVGAFAYPHDQGSQVYFQEQALALRAAGAEVEVLCYGPGRTGARAGPADHPLADLPFHSLPGWAVPESRRSGPQAAKPFADLCLALALRRLVAGRRNGLGDRAIGAPEDMTGNASESASKTASRVTTTHASSASCCLERPLQSPGVKAARAANGRFDAILAHHAEAALLALQALQHDRPPVVYCAHTLLENELPEYFKSSDPDPFSSRSTRSESRGALPANALSRSGAGESAAPDRRAPDRSSSGMTHSALARLGRVIDRRIAARIDGWIALTQSAACVMSAAGSAPGRLIPPPVPAFDDAERLFASGKPQGERTHSDAACVAQSHGLQPGDYFLYAGNLDPYQDLPLLEAVARARRSSDRPVGERGFRAQRAERLDRVRGGAASESLPIVIATHDERAAAFAARAARTGGGGAGLVVCRVESAREAHALLAGARATIVPRRSLGGFPIKLANSLAAGIPVVALRAAEWGLVDGRDALIGDLADPVASIARALERLELDPALAARLGEGARATHRRQHEPARVAAETLALLAALPKWSKSGEWSG